MSTLLISVVLILLLGGRGGYYGYSRYSGTGLGSAVALNFNPANPQRLRRERKE